MGGSQSDDLICNITFDNNLEKKTNISNHVLKGDVNMDITSYGIVDLKSCVSI